MKRALALLHGLPLVVYLVIGFFAYTKWTEWRTIHRLNDERFLASTITAFREIDSVNTELRHQIAAAKKVAARKVQSADRERKAQNEILVEHPVESAPVACSPWITAMQSCRREADSLRAALDALAKPLASADSAAKRTIAVVDSGTTALDNTRCKFPCLDLELVAGPGGIVTVQENAVRVYPGVFAGLKVLRIKLLGK